jgi:Cu(I)/Ag(I) efflux system protein CusF
MQKTDLMILSLGALTLGLTACSPKAPEPAAEVPAAPAASSSMDNMPMPTDTQVSGPITSVGKITAVDTASGAVTLDHQAIPAVKWDAMTMAFTVTDPEMLKDLKVGDMVVFDLKSASEPTKISRIVKQ